MGAWPNADPTPVNVKKAPAAVIVDSLIMGQLLLCDTSSRVPI
jgi:hypothetical protein